MPLNLNLGLLGPGPKDREMTFVPVLRDLKKINTFVRAEIACMQTT
jgi:hypothetical protein